jgi:hypothetical protein
LRQTAASLGASVSRARVASEGHALALAKFSGAGEIFRDDATHATPGL